MTTEGYLDLTTVESVLNMFTTTTQSIIIPEKNVTKSMKSQLVAYDILIPLLGTIIIITNLIVVISSGLILKKGTQPRCTYLLLGNVAMADLITGIAVIMGQTYPKTNRTHFICTLQLGMIVSSTLASIYSVGLIAIDRFLYILYGLKYHRWVYPTRARCMIGATWILGLFIGFMPLFGWSGDTKNGKICWFIMLAPPSLVIFTTIVGLLPVILVIVLYSLILYKAVKKVIQLKNASNETADDDPSKLRMFRGSKTNTNDSKVNNAPDQDQEIETVDPEQSNPNAFTKFLNKLKRNDKKEETDKKPNNPSKWKAIKVVMFTTGSFVCTWMPYFIACTVYVFCDFGETPNKCQRLKFAIASPLAILGFVNSLLNPVIYAWWHNGFRKSIKQLCGKTFRRAKIFKVQSSTEPSSSARKSSQNTTQSSLGTTVNDVPLE